MKKLIISIATIILVATIGVATVEANSPTEANDPYGHVNALLPWDKNLSGSAAGDGIVVRSEEGYAALFMADVNDNRPVRVSVRLSKDRTHQFDCEVQIFNHYATDYDGAVKGRPAIIVIPEGSDFWKLVGSEDIWWIYFGSLEDGARSYWADDMFFYTIDGRKFYEYSAANGWKSWLEVVEQHLGYIYTDFDYSKI